jgi:UDP-GlcNAc:undecaprenyl-phosphate/decaprenyl-phosphate GlcNAc-1-phosphate transferase
VNVPTLAAVAFAVALVATPLAMVVARRTGIMDRPGDLKSQTSPVPYLGGVAVFAGMAIGAAAGRPTVVVPLAAALVLGVADDRFDLPPWLRLAGEVGIGVAVLATCPVRFGAPEAVPLVVVITVLLVNGVNLLDGLDLLAGGVAAVAAVAFALLLQGSGRQLAVASAAALLAFLVFNRPPARIYLGDGGAYLSGTALAVLVARCWEPHVPARVGTAALALVAVPAAEVAFAVVRRVRGRQSLTAGDRGHPYDRLVTRGWPRLSASLVYLGIEAVVAVGAVAIAHHASLGAAIVLDLVVAAGLVGLASAAGALAPDRGAAP